MTSITEEVNKGDNGINQIASALAEVTGKGATSILSEMSANPTHDLAIPSPEAMAVLGKLKAKHGFKITRQDVVKTKKGSYCSFRLLADLFEQKTK